MDEDYHWQCHEYGTQPIPNYNYCFKVILEGATGTIIATCLSPETDEWAGSCLELMNETEDINPARIPQKLRALKITTRIFQIHFGSGSKKSKPKFVVDTATNIVPLLLPAPLPTYQMSGLHLL
ncbi:hypothetical protein CTI12_AA272400 [Artemisia annua]|uniref:Uncharacterized protein n=1 Tax=Artemisia annua TaxID=35608 RepID=A0A2U1LMZ5_ARTAN|nr:hypothetical protein CTI12_AA272400 [Artemisia annua]